MVRDTDEDGLRHARGPEGAEDSPGRGALDWLRAFESAVRARNYAQGRALFADEVIGFGTHVIQTRGLRGLEQGQWRRVWDFTEGFSFVPGETRITEREGVAWVMATWQSIGHGRRGPFPRKGRSTIILERREGRWQAVHTHFSRDPSPRDDPFAERTIASSATSRAAEPPGEPRGGA